MQITPLYKAIRYGHADAARLLLDQGACISVVDDHRFTYLHYAAMYNMVDLIEPLLSIGVEINASRYGRTALHTAAFNGNLSIVQLLIDHGASINVVDRYNDTPLDDTMYKCHKDVATLLRAYGAKSNKYIIMPPTSGAGCR